MTDPRIERARAISTDADDMRREWFRAGADAERARIQAVEQQLLPGHEELIARLKYDGKTTGGQAAIQILAAEQSRHSTSQGKKGTLMTTAQSPKTERGRPLGRLVAYAQRYVSRSEPLQGFDSLIVHLETIHQGGGPNPAEIQELFSAESVLRSGGFTMSYDDRDRVHFNRLGHLPASSPAKAAAQPTPIAPVQPSQKPDTPMTREEQTAIAVQEWEADPRLRREFSGLQSYIAFRLAELAGRVRIIGKRRVQ